MLANVSSMMRINCLGRKMPRKILHFLTAHWKASRWSPFENLSKFGWEIVSVWSMDLPTIWFLWLLFQPTLIGWAWKKGWFGHNSCAWFKWSLWERRLTRWRFGCVKHTTTSPGVFQGIPVDWNWRISSTSAARWSWSNLRKPARLRTGDDA